MAELQDRTEIGTFSVKSQMANSFRFVSHVVSVVTTQFCQCSMKDNTKRAYPCSNKTLLTKKQAVGQICPVDHNCQTCYPTEYKNNSFVGKSMGGWRRTCIPRGSTVLDNYLLNECVVEQIIAETIIKQDNEFTTL